MTTITLSGIEKALRSGRGADTCAPEDVSGWSPENPARGQCGVTALVVNDLLGGDPVCGEVRVAGQVTDCHSCCGAVSSCTSALPPAGVRPSSRSPRGRSSRARSASGCAW
ncbi:YunG family protein [Streptomyces flaveolus]|uniref:YunG family protein n=1 Tax=Streptomyces flaveolus TaxID=67297 RepID=UPI003D9F619C